MPEHTTPDGRCGRLASQRHGLLVRAEVLSAGLTDRQIEHRLRSGRWHRAGPGVYRVAGAPVTGVQVALAAILAAGPTAVSSHHTAAGLFGSGDLPLLPHITVAPTASARTRNAVVHRSHLDPADRTWVGAVPCTTPARTLVDLAAVVDDERLADLVDEVLCAPLCGVAAIEASMARLRPNRAGLPRLRAALEPWQEGITPGSPAEVRLLRRLVDWGLPAPVAQHRVDLGPGLVAVLDLAWPDRMIGLEYDGERHHGPRQLPADVRREERLRDLGWWIGRADRHDVRPSSTRLRDELAQRLRRDAA